MDENSAATRQESLHLLLSGWRDSSALACFHECRYACRHVAFLKAELAAMGPFRARPLLCSSFALPFVRPHHRLDLLLDGGKVERRGRLHRRVFDERLCRRAYGLLHLHETPELAHAGYADCRRIKAQPHAGLVCRPSTARRRAIRSALVAASKIRAGATVAER